MFKKYIKETTLVDCGDALLEYIEGEIEKYEGRFELFNVATQQLFVNNCITEFTKKSKK
jgi:hypothetical protein